jgi:predicted Zn-dependent peptidase
MRPSKTYASSSASITRPNNAVLVIVGDFDPAEARALVEKYFATIPRQPAPPGVDVSEPAEVAAPFRDLSRSVRAVARV